MIFFTEFIETIEAAAGSISFSAFMVPPAAESVGRFEGMSWTAIP